MILELTKENLQNCGFEEDQIIKLLEWDNYKQILIIDENCYFASNSENKIYTGIDGERKKYFEDENIAFPLSCPDLINEYFELSLNSFLEQQKADLKSMYLEERQREKFISIEIAKAKTSIDNTEAMIVKAPHFNTKINLKAIAIYETYMHLLDVKNTEQPKQLKAVITNEDKKEYPTHIFKGNAFEIWKKMFSEFKITNTSRTDIDFMFQIMKYDNLIYDTIGLIDIQNWINEYYEITVDKVKYTDPKAASNIKRMSVYNLINPK